MDDNKQLQPGDVDFRLSWLYVEGSDPESGYFDVHYTPLFSKTGEPVLRNFAPQPRLATRNLPAQIRTRLSLMQKLLLQKFPSPEPKDLGFGPQEPRIEIKQIDYKLDMYPGLVHAIRYCWYGGIYEEVELSWQANQLTETEKALFSSLDEYAWDVAYQDYKRRVGKVEATGRPALAKMLVFVSHRGDSADFAKMLSDRIDSDPVGLFQCYVRPFLDVNDIPAGGTWVSELEEALKTCISFLPIITPTYKEGPVAYREYCVAIDREMRGEISLVPVLLKGDEQDIPQLARPLSYVDFRRYVQTKDDSDFEKEFGRVVHGIMRIGMKPK